MDSCIIRTFQQQGQHGIEPVKLSRHTPSPKSLSILLLHYCHRRGAAFEPFQVPHPNPNYLGSLMLLLHGMASMQTSLPFIEGKSMMFFKRQTRLCCPIPLKRKIDLSIVFFFILQCTILVLLLLLPVLQFLESWFSRIESTQQDLGICRSTVKTSGLLSLPARFQNSIDP